MKQFLLLLTLAGLCAMAQTTVLDISFTPEQMKDMAVRYDLDTEIIEADIEELAGMNDGCHIVVVLQPCSATHKTRLSPVFARAVDVVE